jgi:hypothetical protein
VHLLWYLNKHDRYDLRDDLRSLRVVSGTFHVAFDGFGQSKCCRHCTKITNEEETPGSTECKEGHEQLMNTTHKRHWKRHTKNSYAGNGAGGAPEYQIPKIRSFEAAARRFTLVVVRSFGYLLKKNGQSM